MQIRIENISPKAMIGKRINIAFPETPQITANLWREFMPRRKEIVNPLSSDLLSVQIIDNLSNPQHLEKWAAVEVVNFDFVPEGLYSHSLVGGLYAIFSIKGSAEVSYKSLQYIYEEWIPTSEYDLDAREHFAIMKEGYNPIDPNSEEDIYVPIKRANRQ